MKIGIVTQPLSDNYGGILQNYALQTVLKSMGHEPITLNVIPRDLGWRTWLTHTVKYLLTLSPLTHKEEYLHLYYYREPLMARFVKKNIVTTKVFRNYRHFDVEKMGLQALIVGSDQVWRRQYNWNVWRDKFLAFAENNKIIRIAYGASWGKDKSEYPPAEQLECRRLSQKFNAISVREHSGVKLCQDVLGCDAIEVLDPTLLLKKDDYTRITGDVTIPNEPYLAAYVLDQESWKLNLIKKIADERGLKVVDFGLGKGDVSVEKWLAYFANASYVLTDSFHGTLFSIINNKPFLTVVNESRGASRFESILNKFGLLDRIVKSESQIILQKDIDWSLVDKTICEWRQNSMLFLESNLRENEN